VPAAALRAPEELQCDLRLEPANGQRRPSRRARRRRSQQKLLPTAAPQPPKSRASCRSPSRACGITTAINANPVVAASDDSPTASGARWRPSSRMSPWSSALAVLSLIEHRDEQRFDAAAARWTGRLALEAPGLTLGCWSSRSRLPEPEARPTPLALAGGGRPPGRRRRRSGRTLSPVVVEVAVIAHERIQHLCKRRCGRRRGAELSRLSGATGLSGWERSRVTYAAR
jgi:hypothetical protein